MHLEAIFAYWHTGFSRTVVPRLQLSKMTRSSPWKKRNHFNSKSVKKPSEHGQQAKKGNTLLQQNSSQLYAPLKQKRTTTQCQKTLDIYHKTKARIENSYEFDNMQEMMVEKQNFQAFDEGWTWPKLNFEILWWFLILKLKRIMM